MFVLSPPGGEHVRDGVLLHAIGQPIRAQQKGIVIGESKVFDDHA